MTRTAGTALALALALSAPPAMAQDPATDEGITLLQEGARLLFEGLLSDMEPALRDLEGLTAEMADQLEPALQFLSTEIGPALIALVARIDDLRNYDAPEFLENGDIIIRRKADAPPFEPPPAEDAPAEVEI
jgi:hypothetical protein